MATKRISALTAASAAALTDQIPIEDASNATKKVTAAQLAALLVTGSTINAALGYTAANAAALNASALTSGTVPLARLSGITNAEIAAGAAIADTKLATISTSGKVANAATTATAANTADAIVARDGDGDIAIRDLAARNIAATTLAGDGSAVTDLDADELTAGTVATARLGDGNAHEYGGLAALGSMWLGAPPVSLAIARGGTGLATSITVNGIALTVTRPSAVITRLGGLVTAPAFARASVANNPETGAAASSGAARYLRGRNLLSAAQAACSSGWTTQADGANLTWSYNGSEVVGTASAASTGEAFAEVRLNGARWSGLGMTFAADIEITGHTTGTASISIFDTVSGAAAATDATVGAGNVNTRFSVTRTLRGNLDASSTCIRLRITLPSGTNMGTVIRIRQAQFEEAGSATTWVAGGDHAILIERGTTNHLNAGVETFTIASGNWAEYDGSSVTVTSGQADPFGGTNAYRLQSTGGANRLKFLCGIGAGVAGTRYSGSIWIRNLDAANQIQVASNQGPHEPYVQASEGWVLVKMENILADAVGQIHIQLRTNTIGDNLDILAMWPQYETGPTCTSYIAPGTTRAVDNLALGPVCNPSEGSVIVRAYVAGDQALLSPTSTYSLFDAYQASTTNRILLQRGITGWDVAAYGPTAGALLNGVTWSSALAEGWHTFAVTWKDGVFELWEGGTKRGTSNWNSVMPTSFPSTLVGRSGANSIHHWALPIDTVAIYDRKLTDTDLTALTATTLNELPAHPAETFRQTYAGSLDYTARVVDVTSSGGLVTAANRASAAITV